MYGERLRETLPRVREVVEAAAGRVGRSGGEVRLVAVTKGHPPEAIEAAVDAGIRDVGENRVGELEEKVGLLGLEAARWHMVGHLQRRKAPRLVEICHLLHSVDSVRLAERLSRVLEDRESPRDPFPVLLQVNTSGEEAKYGLASEGAVEAIHRILELPHLRVEGLMTMAPFVDDETVLRGTFRRLRELHEAAGKLDGYEGTELSMGMTNDFPLAVEEGSTMIRVGTALFGERPS